jgi:hypothetical protein
MSPFPAPATSHAACGFPELRGAIVEESIVFDKCDIGRRTRIRPAIPGENVAVPEDTTIGYDVEQDRQLCHVTGLRSHGSGDERQGKIEPKQSEPRLLQIPPETSYGTQCKN